MIASINNLRFHYAGTDEPLLDIPRWSLAGGEQIFLHGHSGTGKSTLLNLLAGMLLPDTGTIDILGKRISTLSARQRDKWRARHIGVVFQQFNLIPYLSPIDNIRLASHFGGKADATARAQQLLGSLGIQTVLFQRPAAQLSIGQQQRVAIARALINRPELLLADEPTSALDRTNRDAFLSLLLEQVAHNHTALIFVSHDLNLAKRFSRVEALADLNHAGGRH
ncbi:ABC transporter ATP-binding protein [Parahaliea mediterranea]|uniref:ABC transporter ATP-binding protein n=1 Tax=Parahaliea mediterranea TaxID=651086 RepID=UPI000E2FA5B1|nr:ATP-binding cassette domain-containing protein [Parahaliea mediterranea]